MYIAPDLYQGSDVRSYAVCTRTVVLQLSHLSSITAAYAFRTLVEWFWHDQHWQRDRQKRTRTNRYAGTATRLQLDIHVLVNVDVWLRMGGVRISQLYYTYALVAFNLETVNWTYLGDSDVMCIGLVCRRPHTVGRPNVFVKNWRKFGWKLKLLDSKTKILKYHYSRMFWQWFVT